MTKYYWYANDDGRRALVKTEGDNHYWLGISAPNRIFLPQFVDDALNNISNQIPIKSTPISNNSLTTKWNETVLPTNLDKKALLLHLGLVSSFDWSDVIFWEGLFTDGP